MFIDVVFEAGILISAMSYEEAIRKLQNPLPGELIKRIEGLYHDLDFDNDSFVRQFTQIAIEAEGNNREPEIFFENHFLSDIDEEQIKDWWESDWQRRGYEDGDKPSFLQKSVHEDRDEVERIMRGEVDFNEQIKRGMKAEFLAILSEIKKYAKNNIVEENRVNE